MGDVDGPIDAVLRRVNNSLVVGGEFAGLRIWDGSAWIPLGPPTNGRIRSIIENGSSLFVAGDFTEAGSAAASHVAVFENGEYKAVGNGLPSDVRVLGMSSDAKLCAGLVDAAPAPLWCWNGTFWNVEPVSGRTVAAIAAIRRDGADVTLVAGELMSADGAPAFAAKYDGTNWTPLRLFDTPSRDQGLAIAPYRGGAVIATWFDCCSASLVWWDDQPLPADKEAIRFPFVEPGDSAMLDKPTSLAVDESQLLVGVSTLRWIEDPVRHISVGAGLLHLDP
jgi:hypothetical protein